MNANFLGTFTKTRILGASSLAAGTSEIRKTIKRVVYWCYGLSIFENAYKIRRETVETVQTHNGRDPRRDRWCAGRTFESGTYRMDTSSVVGVESFRGRSRESRLENSVKIHCSPIMLPTLFCGAHTRFNRPLIAVLNRRPFSINPTTF